MHRVLALLAVTVLLAGGLVALRASEDGPGGVSSASAASRTNVLVGKARKLTGGTVSLSRYRGRVVLVVNTASECVNTPQYGDLEKLYNRRRGKGLLILGFPSGDFGGQELATNGQIKAFCTKNFGVSFPMFAKTHVVGRSAHPLFKRLSRAAGPPNWNFGKYLVDRRGRVVRRFDAYTSPLDWTIVSAIDRQLRQ